MKTMRPRKEKFTFTSEGFQDDINVDNFYIYIKQFIVTFNIHLSSLLSQNSTDIPLYSLTN